jgi:hypothetical protein
LVAESSRGVGRIFNRVCQAVDISWRRAKSYIRAKQTSRCILGNTEETGVRLGATDEHMVRIEHTVNGCIVFTRQFESD